jgi:HEAT repeat protein
MKKLGAILFTLAFGSVSGSALAAPPRLVEVLSMIDVVPTRAQLTAAGAGENGEVLVEIARDIAATSYVRSRAASALSLYDEPATRASLVSLIEDTKLNDREVRIQAIAAYSVLEGRAALPKLALLLNDTEPQIRAAAVRGLVRTKSEEARALLQKRLQEENVPAIRSLITRKLASHN